MKTDRALWFFGLASLACLAVSIPATATAMRLFHGDRGGLAATVVFEIGAVGSELATLAIPQWRRRLGLLTIVLLTLTTGGNYVLGVDTFLSAVLLPGSTYASIRLAGYGPLLAVVSSAIFPSLLFVFLTAFTARCRMLRSGEDWHALKERAVRAEQARAAAEQRVSGLELALDSLRQELSSRPAPVEIEVIQVVRARLTLEQAATLFDRSVSTIRRRVAQLEQKEPAS